MMRFGQKICCILLRRLLMNDWIFLSDAGFAFHVSVACPDVGEFELSLVFHIF